jgi:hypothetical protein
MQCSVVREEPGVGTAKHAALTMARQSRLYCLLHVRYNTVKAIAVETSYTAVVLLLISLHYLAWTALLDADLAIMVY